MRHAPHLLFIFVWIALVVGTIFVIPLTLPLRLLAAANIATFFLFGTDKLIAGSGVFRAPENVLLATAFLGGSLGALLGIHIFRHKTRKAGFQLIIALALILHTVALFFLLGGRQIPILLS